MALNRSYAPGERICVEGSHDDDSGTRVYLIVDGEVALTRNAEAEDEADDKGQKDGGGGGDAVGADAMSVAGSGGTDCGKLGLVRARRLQKPLRVGPAVRTVAVVSSQFVELP